MIGPRRAGRAVSGPTTLVRLAFWMTGLGAATGLAFPYGALAFGLPADLVLAGGFRGACVLAGLGVGGANVLLARGVVGARLRLLSQRMRYVEGVISDATFSGQWGACTPEQCHLPVTSDDDLGEVASAFNALISALAESRAVEEQTALLNDVLRRDLDLVPLTSRALDVFVSAARAEAGVIVLADEEGPRVAAACGPGADALAADPLLARALRTCTTASARCTAAETDGPGPVPPAVPAPSGRVIALPLSLAGTCLGAVVLSFSGLPATTGLRVVDSFLGPTSVALHNAVSYQRARYLACHDELTGVLNRREGFVRLSELWQQSRIDSSSLGILVVDVDNFKLINDTHGHQTGDAALTHVARTLAERLRPDDILVRSGGEEFLVGLPGADGPTTAVVAERLRSSVDATPFSCEGCRASVTVSVGCATRDEQPDATLDQLVASADRAMYVAKRGGRNAVALSDH